MDSVEPFAETRKEQANLWTASDQSSLRALQLTCQHSHFAPAHPPPNAHKHCTTDGENDPIQRKVIVVSATTSTVLVVVMMSAVFAYDALDTEVSTSTGRTRDDAQRLGQIDDQGWRYGNGLLSAVLYIVVYAHLVSPFARLDRGRWKCQCSPGLLKCCSKAAAGGRIGS